jgi:chromate transporter
MNNPWVKAAMDGLKPCVVGIILATGAYMIVENCLPESSFDLRALIISLVLAACLLGAKWMKKKVTPILLIVIGAVAGMAVYAI